MPDKIGKTCLLGAVVEVFLGQEQSKLETLSTDVSDISMLFRSILEFIF